MKAIGKRCVILSLCCSAFTPVAFAQETAGNTGQSSAPAEQTEGLEDIVVTAQRRTESLQRAAVPVDVISASTIAKAQITHPSQLTTLVPALEVGTLGGTSASFFVRGVGTLSANSYTDAGVAFNLDGVYISRPTATSGYFYDVSRIEVLKGPQGTLYGRNATGGAINVIPAPPVLGETSGNMTVSLGNYDSVNLQGAVNLALGEDFALRVAGSYINRDGYLSDGSSDQDSRAIRGQLLYDPSGSVKIRIAADYFERYGQGTGGVLTGTSTTNPFTNTTTITPTGLPLSVGPLDPRVGAVLTNLFIPFVGRAVEPYAVPATLNGRFWGVNAQIDVATPLGELTLVPAYRHNDSADYLAQGGIQAYDKVVGRQVSFEARLAKSIGRLDYLVGGFYFDERYSATFQPYAQFFSGVQTFRSTTESIAGFGRLAYNVTDAFRLVAGARYTHDRKSFDGVADSLFDICTAPTGACPGAPLLPFIPVSDAISQLGLISVAPGVYVQPGNPAAANTIFSRAFKAVDKSLSQGRLTYRVGVEADIAPRSLLYATYETGFRSGGFAFALGKNSFDPETIEAFTIGSKNRLFDNRLQLNVEGYYWRYKDQQVSHLSTDIDGGPVFITENIGRSTIKGVEMNAEYLLAKDTLIGLDVQYLDGKYDSFSYQTPATLNPVLSTPGNPVYFPLVSGCRVPAPVNGTYTVDCSGLKRPYSPTWTVAMRAQQAFHFGETTLTLAADTRYQTSAYVGFDLLPSELRGAYWLSNADATFSLADDRISFSIFVRNIENNRVPSFAQYQSTPQITLAIPSDPRTYGIRASWKF